MIYITLQSQEGRKSRVKFLIAKVSHYSIQICFFDDQFIVITFEKDEPFKNMLNMYCEKFGLPSILCLRQILKDYQELLTL